MNKLFIAALGGTLAGILMTSNFTGPLIAQETSRVKSTYEQLDLFGDIFERIRSAYVEEVDETELIHSAIDGMLSSLDPHSSYLEPQDFGQMQVQTRGEFGGLGIEVTQENGFVKVVSPIDGTPADEAGVEAGDFITHVDGEPVLGLTLNEAVELMRGPVGSEIEITIVRDGTEEPFEIKIVRDTIKLTAVRSRLEDKSIYLRLTTFNEQTFPVMAERIEKHVEELGGFENVDGFVLDLRNNPGGLLDQAIKVSDAFLDKGEIVSTRGRERRDSERHNATEGDLTNGKPLVVLINGGSASASEIVAGALQDHHRAVIVGEKTFGKGAVQTIMPLQGDGAIRLTTARYYTPSGRSIQALGVAPDIIVPLRRDDEAEADEEERSARTEADLRGSLSNDSLTEDQRRLLEEERTRQEETAKRRADDSQLAYALDLITGMTVVANN
jgi:carboxyl-terminal processing protease